MNIIRKKLGKGERDYFWVVEVLIFVTITPALVHSVLALRDLPVV